MLLHSRNVLISAESKDSKQEKTPPSAALLSRQSLLASNSTVHLFKALLDGWVVGEIQRRNFRSPSTSYIDSKKLWTLKRSVVHLRCWPGSELVFKAIRRFEKIWKLERSVLHMRCWRTVGSQSFYRFENVWKLEPPVLHLRFWRPSPSLGSKVFGSSN